jgi:hypothetical protein
MLVNFCPGDCALAPAEDNPLINPDQGEPNPMKEAARRMPSRPARPNRKTFATLATTNTADANRIVVERRHNPYASNPMPSASRTAEYAYHSSSLVDRK